MAQAKAGINQVTFIAEYIPGGSFAKIRHIHPIFKYYKKTFMDTLTIDQIGSVLVHRAAFNKHIKYETGVAKQEKLNCFVKRIVCLFISDENQKTQFMSLNKLATLCRLVISMVANGCSNRIKHDLVKHLMSYDDKSPLWYQLEHINNSVGWKNIMFLVNSNKN